MADAPVTERHEGLRVESRSAALRRRHRQVLAWSLGLAVVIHAAVLFYGPWLRNDPGPGSGTELVAGSDPALGGLAVNVFFGPPAIVLAADSLSQEPSWRVLKTSRILPPPFACSARDWLEVEYARGSVRLIVGPGGRPDTVSLDGSTGSRCWDAVMTGLATDLRYRWLPSDRYPAPVEVFQPMTLSPTDF